MTAHVRNCVPGSSKDAIILVLLIEPHPLAARQLMVLLSQNRRLKLLNQRDITKPTESARESRWLVVIDRGSLATSIDICIASLRNRLRNIRMLVIGPRPDVADLSKMMFLGVWGFIDYESVADQLNQAICAVWSGRAWVPPEVLRFQSTFIDTNPT